MAPDPASPPAPTPATAPDDPVRPRDVVAAVAVALAVAAALSTDRMVAVAERLPFGPLRSALVAGLAGVDAVADGLRLSAPSAAAHRARAALGLQRGDALSGAGAVADGQASFGAGATSDGAGGDDRAATAIAVVRGAGGDATAAARAATPAAGAAGADRPRRPPATPRPSPRPVRAVGRAAPLRVVVAGDSFAQPLGFELQRIASRDGMTAVEVDGRISTGLARPDYFDWPAHMAEIVAGLAPEVVVFFAGANDDQNMILADDTVVELGTSAWTDAYSARAAALMDACRGVPLYWVGLPVMRDPEDHRAAEQVNTAVERAAAGRDWVTFVDIWRTFQGPDGRFSLYLPDETGEPVELRGADGVHLSRRGTNQVAARLYAAFDAIWDLATPTPSPTLTPTPSTTPTTTATASPPAATRRAPTAAP